MHMTDNKPHLTTLEEKMAALAPARRARILAAANKMEDDIVSRETILDELVADAQKNDMGY